MSARADKKLLLGVIALLWTLGSAFVVGPAGVALALVARVSGQPRVLSNLVAIVVVEAFIYLVVALAVFAVARLAGPPSWYWLIAPLGYLVGVALWFGLTYLAGAEATPEGGYGIVVAVDVAAVSLGGLFGTVWWPFRRRAPSTGGPIGSGPDTNEPAAPDAGGADA